MKDALELNVYRTFSDGSRVLMGHVASDGDEIWYRFDQNYLVEHPKGNPSPIRTPYTHKPILGPNRPNAGLHGFLADSLPDGWGLRLMDRVFENHGLDPMSVTPLERTCPKTGGCEKFVRTPKTKGAALAAPFVHPDVGTGQVSDGVSGALSLRHSGTPLEQFHGRNWSMCGPYESSARSQSA